MMEGVGGGTCHSVGEIRGGGGGRRRLKIDVLRYTWASWEGEEEEKA